MRRRCGAVIENRENIRAKKEEEEGRISVCTERRSNKAEKSCCIVQSAQKEVCGEKAGNLP